jgi:hypothetical protein
LDRSNNAGTKEAMSDGERDPYVLGPYYEPARDALLVAVRIDPKSRKIQQLLARTELVLAESPEHFLVAHERIDRVIRSILDDKTHNADELFDCRTLQSEVAFRWAEHERRFGGVNQETLRRMRAAFNDLRTCTQFLENRPLDPFGDVEGAKRKYYHNLHDRVRATVTLAEVEMDLSDAQESKSHLKNCQMILQNLVAYTSANGLEGKVPTTFDLAARIKKGNKRLEGLDVANRRSSLDARPRSAQAG